MGICIILYYVTVNVDNIQEISIMPRQYNDNDWKTLGVVEYFIVFSDIGII